MYRQDGRPVLIVGADDKPRWQPIWDGNPAILSPAAAHLAPNGSYRILMSGPNCRPYIVPPFTAETGWTFNTAFRCREHVATLYLTDGERQRGETARSQYGPYVLIEPYTKHENFRWPLKSWASLVKACPDLTFVQHTHAASVKVKGAHYEPATFSEACGLIASADLYVRSESGLCHAAAALGIPQVTIFGGCMNPEVMGYYPDQTVMADRGPGSPCGRWLPCAHCAAVMERLSVDDVVEAMREALARRTGSER